MKTTKTMSNEDALAKAEIQIKESKTAIKDTKEFNCEISNRIQSLEAQRVFNKQRSKL